MALGFPDASNGYEENAEIFMASRNPRIGVATVLEWSESLPHGASILDLGCGSGVPISQVLVEGGFAVHGVDASPRMIAAFRQRFPTAPAECAEVAHSTFLNRNFDAVIAWGLLFLLPADAQASVIGKVARALNGGGKFVFTAPREALRCRDVLTERESISLGYEQYLQLLHDAGLALTGEASDEGENHYYMASKP